MIKFIFKGIIRDRSRSLFPVLTVVIGVAMTVFGISYIRGLETTFVQTSARFNTGHLKIMSRAYAENADQVPNDLAYIGVGALIQELERDYPGFNWTPRIRFGGLLDVPDERGETRSQGPASGMAVDLFSGRSLEWDVLKLENAVIRGRLPENPGEILISEDFAQRLDVQPGDTATLISSTMYGSMATANFMIAGTVRFGVAALDRGAMLADLLDIQTALDMEDAAGEVFGFFNDFLYRAEEADATSARFNAKYARDEEDEFLPVMVPLHKQSGLGDMLAMINTFFGAILLIFVVAMSIVLWNAGLIGSLRRYGEIGVRLAIGESKGHLYRSLLVESMMIGFIGSVLGTALGLAASYYLQAHGINIGGLMQNASLLVSDVIRARVTPLSYVIGFIPGFLATFIGTSIAGIGIYRRKTSRLMKELEA